jgi:hypothetical protein
VHATYAETQALRSIKHAAEGAHENNARQRVALSLREQLAHDDEPIVKDCDCHAAVQAHAGHTYFVRILANVVTTSQYIVQNLPSRASDAAYRAISLEGACNSLIKQEHTMLDRGPWIDGRCC